MRVPIIRGIIDRRILANFRVDADVMASHLPPPFRPKLVDGYSIGGICLIRLISIRPRFLPAVFGIRSENAAHRIAVEWETGDGIQQGVYIPRRDSDSRLHTLVGGSIFPGIHHHAKFTVEESDSKFSVSMISDDDSARVLVVGELEESLPETSIFSSVTEASRFFELGSLGYSDTNAAGRFDGLELKCDSWDVQPLKIVDIASSYFENASRFPPGSVNFDCALLMRDIHHEWHGREDLCCPANVGAVSVSAGR